MYFTNKKVEDGETSDKVGKEKLKLFLVSK